MIFADAHIEYKLVEGKHIASPKIRIVKQPLFFRLLHELTHVSEKHLAPIEAVIDTIINKVGSSVKPDFLFSLEYAHYSNLCEYTEKIHSVELVEVDFPGTTEELAKLFNYWPSDWSLWQDEDD